MSNGHLGRPSGFIAIGTVVNHEDDPSQSGKVRVRWQSGAAEQHEIADGDLPWTGVLHSPHNPSLDQVGGPHTGLLKGSVVMGIPVDGAGQDFIIIGSMVKGGKAGLDEPAQWDSQIPQAAKESSKGGESQPRYGDVNGVVTQESIVKYAEAEGGGSSAKYATIDDPIGTLDRAIT